MPEPLTRRQFNKMVATLVATGATIGISSKAIARRIWKKLRVHPMTILAAVRVNPVTVVTTGAPPAGVYSDSYAVAY